MKKMLGILLNSMVNLSTENGFDIDAQLLECVDVSRQYVGNVPFLVLNFNHFTP